MTKSFVTPWTTPWTEEDISLLRRFWPHWGSQKTAWALGISKAVVKSQVDQLCLRMLPKSERDCSSCLEGKQYRRSAGSLCRKCFSIRRSVLRRLAASLDPVSERMKDQARTLRYRSKEPCDVDAEFLIELWKKQDGKCAYTGRPMIASDAVGRGRSLDTLSIDRIDSSRGYTKGNITLCSWWANRLKADLTFNDFTDRCRAVAKLFPEAVPEIDLESRV